MKKDYEDYVDDAERLVFIIFCRIILFPAAVIGWCINKLRNKK